jgi:sulfite exporter TauE/SafE
MDNFTLILTLALMQGLSSSLHCLTMCGPLLGAVTTISQSKWVTNGIYQMGRFFSYTVLGMVLGLSGTGADSLGDLTQIQWMSGVVSGIFLVYIGSKLILGTSFHNPLLPYFAKFSSPIYKRKSQPNKNPLITAFLFGSLSGFLPCGVLYPAYALAFSSGDIFGGGLVMGSFFLGTFPALFFAGESLHFLRKFTSPKTLSYSGILLVCMGLGTVFFRIYNTSSSSEPQCHTPGKILKKNIFNL